MALSSKDVDLLQEQKMTVEDAIAQVPQGTSFLKEYEDLASELADIVAQLQEIQQPAITLFDAIATNGDCALEHLHLDGKHLGNASMEALAVAFASNRTITSLDLTTNFISDLQPLGLELRMHRLSICIKQGHGFQLP